jgi:hypothetical protein
MIERGAALRQFPWPQLSPALLASALRWLMLILAVAALAWLIGVLRHRTERSTEGKGAVGAEE